MKKEAQVVMLPTDKKSALNPIVKDTYNNKLKYVKLNLDTRGYLKEHQMTANYLYIVDDSEIKEGDWVLFSDVVMVAKSVDDKVVYDGEGNSFMKHDCSKIIGTTDPELTLNKTEKGTFLSVKTSDTRVIQVPQIPQSFIKSYCKNPVEKVMVEYEYYYEGSKASILIDNGNEPIIDCDDEEFQVEIKDLELRFKVNSNNELIIHPIEEKLYTRGEVIDIIHQTTKHAKLADYEIYEETIEEHVKKHVIDRLI